MDDLKNFYEKAYSVGKENFFVKYRNGADTCEEHQFVLSYLNSNSNTKIDTILDFGCGEGDFLNLIQTSEKKIGIDFSKSAIENGSSKHRGIDFQLGSSELLANYPGQIDLLTSFGTIEHLDNPRETVKKFISCLSPGGKMMLSCPSFLNLRGIIWMTLVKLFDVPMSLSDRHFISPKDIEQWICDSGRKVEKMISFDVDLSQGDYLEKDLNKRLTNALRDAQLKNDRVENLLKWTKEIKNYLPVNELSGANMLFIIG